jgi:hypothetical protein
VKRLKNKCLVSLMSFLFVSLMFSNVYASSCDGVVIVNNSNQPWDFQFNPYDGRVHFNGGVSCPVNGPCKIPPHATANIEYTHTVSRASGTVVIRDNRKNKKSFSYDNRGNVFKICPEISHNGNTGSVSVNEPHDGSFTIDRDNW